MNYKTFKSIIIKQGLLIEQLRAEIAEHRKHLDEAKRVIASKDKTIKLIEEY